MQTASAIGKWPNKDAEFSILLLGLDNAGKTTLLSSIKSLYNPSAPPTAQKTVPTVGQNVATIDLGDVYLKIWDVGGQHSLRRLWQSYYESCHAVVFVVDSSDLGDSELDDLQNDGIDGDPTADATDERDGESEDQGGGQQVGRLQECRLVLES